MKKSLADRLLATKDVLRSVDQAALRQSLSADVREGIKEAGRFQRDIDHWLRIIRLRDAKLRQLKGMAAPLRALDRPPPADFEEQCLLFEESRLEATMTYLVLCWSAADRIVASAGGILFSKKANRNKRNPPHLSLFMSEDMNDGVPSVLTSIRPTFGWTSGILFAIRNHFIHEGGQLDGKEFFEVPDVAGGFAISEAGWTAVESRAREYGLSATNSRTKLPDEPRADLRVVLELCQLDMDEAVGVIYSSACAALLAHVTLMNGED